MQDSINKNVDLYIKIVNFSQISNLLQDETKTKKIILNIIRIAKEVCKEKKVKIKLAKSFVVFRFSSYFDKDKLILESLSLAIEIAKEIASFDVKFSNKYKMAIQFFLHLTVENVDYVMSDFKDFIFLNTAIPFSNKFFNNLIFFVDPKVLKVSSLNFDFFTFDNTQSSFLQILNLEKYVEIKNIEPCKSATIINSKENTILEKDENKAKDTILSLKEIKKKFEEKTKPLNLKNKSTTIANFFDISSFDLDRFLTEQMKKSNKNIFIFKKDDSFTVFQNISNEVFQNKTVIKINCDKSEQIYPYFALRELVKKFYKINEEDIFKNSSILFKLSPFLQNLLKLEKIENVEPEMVFEGMFQGFEQLFAKINNNYILMFENFEQIDMASNKILERIIAKNSLNTHIFICVDENFNFFKKNKNLLNIPTVFHLTIIPSTFEEACIFFTCDLNKNLFPNDVALSKEFVEKWLDFLIAQKKLYIENNKIECENIDIKPPESVDEIVSLQISELEKHEDLLDLFYFMTFAKERLSLNQIEFLDFKNASENIDILEKRHFIKRLDKNLEIDNIAACKKALSQYQFKVKNCDNKSYYTFYSKLMPKDHPLLCEFTDDINEQISESLADVSLCLCDFWHYLKLKKQQIATLSDTDEKREENLKTLLDLNLNLIETLYEKTPLEILSVFDDAFLIAQQTNNAEAVKQLLYLLSFTNYMNKNYINSFSCVEKAISLETNREFNIKSPKFNPKLFKLLLKHVELLFLLGESEKSSNLFERLIKNINKDNMKNAFEAYRSEKEFFDSFNLGLFLWLFESILNLKDNFFSKLKRAKTIYVGESICLEAFQLFFELFKNFSINEKKLKQIENETKSSETLVIVQLLKISANYFSLEFKDNSYDINILKRPANKMNNFCLLLLTDIFSASVHCAFKDANLANEIFIDIINKSHKCGLSMIEHFAKYLLAKNLFMQNEIEQSLNLVENEISVIEEYNIFSPFLIINFKKLRLNINIQMKKNFEQTKTEIFQLISLAKCYRLKNLENEFKDMEKNLKKFFKP